MASSTANYSAADHKEKGNKYYQQGKFEVGFGLGTEKEFLQ
jgi:hypothetical protein